MPDQRGSHAKHERNLERNLETPPAGGASEAPRNEHGARDSGGTEAAAKLARDAAHREAVRRATGRTEGPGAG